jgi:hypothetical protein
MSRDIKYIGMDVHKEAVVIAVLNASGKLVMESIVETKASSILQFIHGLRGELHVTWEEGTWAAWLYDLLQPQVAQVLVCDPRRNALLKEGNKSDKVDAHKLADLLRTGMLRPVYHGEHGLRTLRELGRIYQTLSQDLNRVMNRIKALYRGWSIQEIQFFERQNVQTHLCWFTKARNLLCSLCCLSPFRERIALFLSRVRTWPQSIFDGLPFSVMSGTVSLQCGRGVVDCGSHCLGWPFLIQPWVVSWTRLVVRCPRQSISATCLLLLFIGSSQQLADLLREFVRTEWLL